MRMDAQRAVAIARQLDSDGANWDSTYEDLARYFLPQRSGFTGPQSPGEEKTEYLFDSIGMECGEDLSNYVQSVTTPAGQDWFGIQFRSSELNKKRLAKEWLQEVSKRMHQEIRESNFEAEASEYYKDYCIFGTAAMDCREKKGPNGYDGLAFRQLNLREMRGMDNADGQMDITVRVVEMTATQLRMLFENDPNVVEGSLPEEDPENLKKLHKVVHIVWPRDFDQVDEKAYGFEKVPANKMQWGSMWVMYDDATLIKEGGFYEPSRSIARWYRNVDSWNGYSPALQAKPDVKTINEAQRLEMVAWEKRIDPPILTEDQNVLGDLDIAAGKITTVTDINGTKPFMEGTDFNVSMIKAEEKRQAVRQVMFVDVIREPLGDSGQKTAFEVAKRVERANRLLGQATARLRFEFLNWLVMRVFTIMYRNDRLPEFPPELEGDVELDIRYTSPLATSQETAKLESVDMFVSRMSGIAQARSPQNPGEDPIWDWFDEEGYVEVVKDAQNVMAEVVRSKEDVAKSREDRQAAQESQSQLEMIDSAAKAVKDIGQGAGQEAAQEMMEAM